MTVIRHVGVLRAAGIIHRDLSPFATRRHRVRYGSNHYTLLAPGALIQFENNEVVCTNIPNLKPKLNSLNKIKNKGLDQFNKEKETTLKGCVHSPYNALPHPMWKCRDCGEIFEAAIG